MSASTARRHTRYGERQARLSTRIDSHAGRYARFPESEHETLAVYGPSDESLAPDELSDFEYTAEIDGFTVEISKIGGGTLGRAYKGRWEYRATRDGNIICEGNDLGTGMPKTHEEAAEIVADYVSTDGWMA